MVDNAHIIKIKDNITPPNKKFFVQALNVFMCSCIDGSPEIHAFAKCINHK